MASNDYRKAAQHIIATLPATKKTPQKQDIASSRLGGKPRENMLHQDKEQAIVDAIDSKRLIERHADLIFKLENDGLPIEKFLNEVSPRMMHMLFQLAECAESEKVKFEAIREILALAGYSKVQKVAIANVDPNADKRQLKSLVEGLAGKLEDVEIVDD